ncbi:MAG TPA: helix-turn-helix domain-containing protein [Pirellulales bacterium]|jgi:excisionase family DNA binding protein
MSRHSTVKPHCQNSDNARQRGTARDALLITANEAAAMLTVCTKTLQRITSKKLIPVVRLGASVRYRPADVIAYIDRLAAESVDQHKEAS